MTRGALIMKAAYLGISLSAVVVVIAVAVVVMIIITFGQAVSSPCAIVPCDAIAIINTYKESRTLSERATLKRSAA